MRIDSPSRHRASAARGLARHLSLRVAILTLAVLLAPGALVAQTVRGTLAVEGSLQPVGGAVVTLIDDEGRRLVGTLSDDEGGFELTAPIAGAYRLRAERIGFATTFSPPIELHGTQPIVYRMTVRNEAITLGGIEVTARGRACRIRPEDGAELHRVWDEARKALEAADLSDDRQVVWMRRSYYERQWDADGRSLLHERTWRDAGWATVPFATLPASDLAQDGYVREEADTTLYYGPDASVLLSDEFLDTHCFRLSGRQEGGETLLGLEFEPVASQREPDIEGVLWLDRESGELRYIEYEYTRLPVAGRQPFGGRMDLERTPSGAWIVSRWSIRMPIWDRETVAGPTGIPSRRTRLLAVEEEGGEVTELGNGADARVAVLAGAVFDPGVERGLAGARVYLSGTSYTATTGDDGTFRIEVERPGRYEVSFFHPVLDSIGGFPPALEVELEAGGTSEIELRPPPGSAIVGRVLDTDGYPVASADVMLAETGRRATTTAEGYFRFFGVEAGVYALDIRYPGLASQSHSIELAPESAAPIVLTMDIRPIDLPGVEVTARAARRQRAVGGVTIDAEQIERIKPVRFADLFRSVMGVRLRQGRGGGEIIEAAASRGWPGQSSNPRIVPNPTLGGGGAGTAAPGTPSSNAEPDVNLGNLTIRSEPEPCPMLMYLNGNMMFNEDTGMLLHHIPPATIEAIDVWVHAAMVPVEYRNRGWECGVIAIWTKP